MDDFQDWSWTAEWQEDAAARRADEELEMITRQAEDIERAIAAEEDGIFYMDTDLFHEVHVGLEPF